MEAKRRESTKWLKWVGKMAEIAQNGLNYATDVHDIERYNLLRSLAAEIAEKHTDAEASFIRGIFQMEEGHTTPKVDVRGAVFCGDAILLVKEIADGLWTLPGGWADPYEPPGKAVEREVEEESGFKTKATRLLAVYDRDSHDHPSYPFSIYMMFFECEIKGGKAAVSNETEAVRFFKQHEIPPLSTDRVTEAQVARVFHHHYHPDLATDFD